MSTVSSSCPESPVFSTRKSQEKLLHSSSKRKLLLSPSKDLMIFFDKKTFTKFNPICPHKQPKPNNKLTLNRKNNDSDKKIKSKNPALPNNNSHKLLSITNSTDSFNSNQEIQKSYDGKKAQLKKQVDQIRRKYSYSKLGPKNGIKKALSTEFLRLSAEVSSVNNSNVSLSHSKEKSVALTPTNDRCIGKRILIRNVFVQKSNSNLKLKENSAKTLKLNTQESQELKQKQGYEFERMVSSVNLNSKVAEREQNEKMFQFTFGSMAMMDFQNKENLRGKLKISNYE